MLPLAGAVRGRPLCAGRGRRPAGGGRRQARRRAGAGGGPGGQAARQGPAGQRGGGHGLLHRLHRPRGLPLARAGGARAGARDDLDARPGRLRAPRGAAGAPLPRGAARCRRGPLCARPGRPRAPPSPRPRRGARPLQPAALPPPAGHLAHGAAGGRRQAAGAARLAAAAGVPPVLCRTAAARCARLCLCMARACLAPHVHGGAAQAAGGRQAVGKAPAGGAASLPGAVPAARPADAARAPALQGHPTRAAGAAPRFSRVSLRLPLCPLQRDPACLHPDAQPDPLGLPAQHAPARPLHAQPQGRPPARDQPVAARAQRPHCGTAPRRPPGGGRRLPGHARARLLPGRPRRPPVCARAGGCCGRGRRGRGARRHCA
mmetsp:Transcript_5625/g.21749  ORF Transcript_5625/g.21749 Transcript_5625/m.21749 type:complete len:375 (+) Transcript_5625:835-1959(+)